MREKHSESDHALLEHEQNIVAAHRAHDVEKEHGFRLNEAAINNANLVLRALLIINGAAALALLAFLSNIESAMPDEAAPLISFAGGVAVTAIAMGLAYFTNYCYTTASVERVRSYKHPYIQENDKSSRWIKIGLWSHIVAVGLVIFAIVFFICGVFGTHSIIKSL